MVIFPSIFSIIVSVFDMIMAQTLFEKSIKITVAIMKGGIIALLCLNGLESILSILFGNKLSGKATMIVSFLIVLLNIFVEGMASIKTLDAFFNLSLFN